MGASPLARLRQLARRHPLWVYFFLAYAISWSLWLPLIATVQGWWSLEAPDWWHYTGAAGPIVAATVTAALGEGRYGLRALFGQYSPRRVRAPWLAFAVLAPLVSAVTGIVIVRITDGDWVSYGELSRTDNLPGLGLPVVLLIHVLSFGVGEETGWRGFALPRFQSTLGALAATHRLAVLWALWHVPSFFENPSMMEFGPLQIVGWSAGLWMGAIFLSWLYNSAQGSLIVVVVWHGLFNLFSASEAPSALPAIMTMAVIVIAIEAIQLAGPQELRGLSRYAGRRQQHFRPGDPAGS